MTATGLSNTATGAEGLLARFYRGIFRRRPTPVPAPPSREGELIVYRVEFEFTMDGEHGERGRRSAFTAGSQQDAVRAAVRFLDHTLSLYADENPRVSRFSVCNELVDGVREDGRCVSVVFHPFVEWFPTRAGISGVASVL